MTARRPVVVALLPMVWSVRNVVYGGVLRRLAERGVAVRLLPLRAPTAAELAERPDFAPADAVEAMVAPARRPGARARGKALLDEVQRAAFARHHGIASHAIYRRWFDRGAGAAARWRAHAVAAAGAAAARPAALGWLQRRSERLYRDAHDLAPVRDQLRRLAPDLVWSTTCVAAPEYPYALAARDLGLPTVTSILSFDNLTSRGTLPPYDHYLVWSERMAAQLRALYPAVGADGVTVTGTPQFDFHRRPRFTWSRDETLARLGLPAGARYVVYSASHQQLTPDEPALVAAMLRRLAGEPGLRDLHVVLRLHPLEDWARWAPVREASDRLHCSPAWDAPPAADGWTLATPADQARLVSTLAHASACVNIASTMTLDAALLDRPVIGLDLAGEPDAPRELLYAEYGADHYRPLVASGGLRLARTWGDLAALLRQALDEPARDAAARARMVREECGVADGAAADRVAAAIVARLAAAGAPLPGVRAPGSLPAPSAARAAPLGGPA